jgi:undecaprenyl-phosphate galactose phosphotransferase
VGIGGGLVSQLEEVEALSRQALDVKADVNVATRYAESARAGRILPFPTTAPTFYQRRGKRLLDITLGSVLFVGLLPIMAAVAVAVLLTSGFPVLYAAERVGKNGRPFLIWKFRTMVRDAEKVLERWKETHHELAGEYERDFKLADDPRITALGRFLRKSRLDELPQLWNVICGEMSLVGPRPIVEREVSKYGERAGMFLSVRPGITGRWQMNGRNHVTYPDRVWIELAYCRSVTLLGDAGILVQTLTAPLRYDGN